MFFPDFVDEDERPLGLGKGGLVDDGAAIFVVGLRFNGEGIGAAPPLFLRLKNNGMLLFLLPLFELEDSACSSVCGGIGGSGVSFGGCEREAFDCPLFPPKKSDKPDVLVLGRAPGVSPDIKDTRKE